MHHQTRHQAEASMAAWAEITKAPALALVHATDKKLFRVLEATVDGSFVIRPAEIVLDTVWTQHSAGIVSLSFVNAYSAAFCSAIWQVHEVTIEVLHGTTDLTAALEASMAAANESTDWRTANDSGPTFIDALAAGDEVDPWRNDARDHIPAGLTEEGPLPVVLIRMAGGRIDDVQVVRGEAHVVAINRDGEALDRGPHITMRDDKGKLLLTHWSGPDGPAGLPRNLLDALGLVTSSSDQPA